MLSLYTWFLWGVIYIHWGNWLLYWRVELQQLILKLFRRFLLVLWVLVYFWNANFALKTVWSDKWLNFNRFRMVILILVLFCCGLLIRNWWMALGSHHLDSLLVSTKVTSLRMIDSRSMGFMECILFSRGLKSNLCIAWRLAKSLGERWGSLRARGDNNLIEVVMVLVNYLYVLAQSEHACYFNKIYYNYTHTPIYQHINNHSLSLSWFVFKYLNWGLLLFVIAIMIFFTFIFLKQVKFKIKIFN